MALRPLLVYMGNKSRTAGVILPLLPTPRPTGWYFEPFCGTAAVALAYNHPNTVLADTNKDVLRVHVATRDTPDEVWHEYRRLARHWCSRSPAGRGLMYLQLLDLHNSVEQVAHTEHQVAMDAGNWDDAMDSAALHWTSPVAAARLLFLSRHAWHGVMRRRVCGWGYQRNSADVTKGTNPADLVELGQRHAAISERFRQIGWGVYCLDYRRAVMEAMPGDAVYLDPPYPGQYSSCAPAPHADVARLFCELHRRGVVVVLTTNTREHLEEFGHVALGANYRCGRGVSGTSTPREHWLITNSPNVRPIPRLLGPAPAPAEPAQPTVPVPAAE